MAPLFDTTKMSADEFQFIRAYCAAARREYYSISTAIALTDPAELGLICPFTVTKIAIGLQGMYREVAHELAEIGQRHLPARHPADCRPTLVPTIDEVGQIFSVSFFKLVDAATQSSIVTSQNKGKHDGWSSGRPTDWQHSLKSLCEIQKQRPDHNSAISIAVQKLFSIFMSYKFSDNKKFPELDDYDDDDYDDDNYYDVDEYYPN